jgi:hypothetical protein
LNLAKDQTHKLLSQKKYTLPVLVSSATVRKDDLMVRDLSEVVNLYIHGHGLVVGAPSHPSELRVEVFEYAMPGHTFRVEVDNQQGKHLQTSSET